MGLFSGRVCAGKGPNTQEFSADLRVSTAGISVGLRWAPCTVSKAPVSVSGYETSPAVCQALRDCSPTPGPPFQQGWEGEAPCVKLRRKISHPAMQNHQGRAGLVKDLFNWKYPPSGASFWGNTTVPSPGALGLWQGSEELICLANTLPFKDSHLQFDEIHHLGQSTSAWLTCVALHPWYLPTSLKILYMAHHQPLPPQLCTLKAGRKAAKTLAHSSV